MEHLVLGIAAFLAVVLAVTTLCRRFELNESLVLMLVGIVGSFLPFVHPPNLSPELILVGALPPLLYASAINTSLVDFRRDASTIGWLSIGLVIFTALGVGVVVHEMLGVAWAPAFAIGAVVAPPDAVAATAVARSIGLPRRVVSVLEGESLVNDATALVALNTATAAMVGSVSFGGVAADFLRAVAVAILVGLAVAKLVSIVYRYVPDATTSTALSLMTPFLAYVPSEELHGSGVLAVVVAGLVLGHKSARIQTGETRLAQRINWRTISYLLENSVFLLIGLQARKILEDAAAVGLAGGRVLAVCVATLVAVMVLRVLWIFATRVLVHIGPRDASTPWREALVQSWAGMRGVVTLAAALTLPSDTPYRPILILIALVVTVGTLLIQGLTLPVLARHAGVYGPDPREDTLQEATAYAHAVTAGSAAMRAAANPGDEEIVQRIESLTNRRLNAIWERLGRPEDDVETPSETYRRLRQVSIEAERNKLLKLRDSGHTEAEVLSGLLMGLDVEEASLQPYTRVNEEVRSTPLRPQLPNSPCEHLAESPFQVAPTSLDCPECTAEGTQPVHLRMCLACGHVGCCDSSVGMHATRHFEQTGHPTMRSIEPGESWRWCYLDGLLDGGA